MTTRGLTDRFTGNKLCRRRRPLVPLSLHRFRGCLLLQVYPALVSPSVAVDDGGGNSQDNKNNIHGRPVSYLVEVPPVRVSRTCTFVYKPCARSTAVTFILGIAGVANSSYLFPEKPTQQRRRESRI